MPRQRLHKSSIVVGLIVALLLALIEIPGRVVSGAGSPNGPMVYEHGWPGVYLRRETPGRASPTMVRGPDGRQLALQPSLVFNPLDPRYDLPRWGIPWLTADNWRFWDVDTSTRPPHWDLNPIVLSCDLAIALVVFAGVVVAWEFGRRRGAKPFSFRFDLRSLLLAIAAVGSGLGWLTHLEREHRRETVLIDREFERSGPMEATWYDIDIDRVCIAPLWLRSLVGVRLWPEYLWRASAVYVHPERGEKTDLMCAEIAQLDYVTKVSIDGHPRRHFRFSALSILEQLETLEIWVHPIIEDQDVKELAQLRQLRKIVIEDLDEIAPEVLGPLKVALPNCKIVGYSDDW